MVIYVPFATCRSARVSRVFSKSFWKAPAFPRKTERQPSVLSAILALPVNDGRLGITPNKPPDSDIRKTVVFANIPSTECGDLERAVLWPDRSD